MEKMQQAQFMREKHTELEDRIRTVCCAYRAILVCAH